MTTNTMTKYEEVARALARQLARVSAWRFARGERGITRQEYGEAPKDGGTSVRYLGTYPSRDSVPAEATHVEPVAPRLHKHMALVPPGRTVVSFSIPGDRLDLDDGSAVVDGKLRAPGDVASHDAIWRAVALGPKT